MPLRAQVLVVGAGPAGAYLARGLAQRGVSVVLADRLSDLGRAAFSSAAMPLEALDRFGLPASVVAARWSGWELLGPADERRCWMAPQPLGAVLDFAALRRFLVEEATRWGARLLLGHTALSWQEIGGGVRTTLRSADGEISEVRSDWMIDATGQARALLGDPPPGAGAGPLVEGLGLEWLVAVPEACWQRWSDRLSFALGSGWVSQGYGWVFPMRSPQLKIGVCRLIDPGRAQPPLGVVMEQMVQRLIGPGDRRLLQVLDRHGGLIRSTISRGEPHGCGRLVAVGDAVSTANLLGGEGIRHALSSSRALIPLLAALCREPPASTRAAGGTGQRALALYRAHLRQALGWRWSLSGRLARRTWLGLHDGRADRRLSRLLRSLENQPAEALSALLFDYRFERYGWRALPYLLGWR
ncbi:MAG: NAD(P)/FAD-dependent oxidoreductase [Cyanobium sp.]